MAKRTNIAKALLGEQIHSIVNEPENDYYMVFRNSAGKVLFMVQAEDCFDESGMRFDWSDVDHLTPIPPKTWPFS